MKYLKRFTKVTYIFFAIWGTCFVAGIGAGFAYHGFKWAQYGLATWFGF